MSVCQYVRMQLFSLGIKMKVVQNVIRMSDTLLGLNNKKKILAVSSLSPVCMHTRYSPKTKYLVNNSFKDAM